MSDWLPSIPSVSLDSILLGVICGAIVRIIYLTFGVIGRFLALEADRAEQRADTRELHRRVNEQDVRIGLLEARVSAAPLPTPREGV